MNKRPDSLISLSSSDNDLSETDSESEADIVMCWVSSGNQMLTRALSHKDSQKGNKNRSSYTKQPAPTDPRTAELKERLGEKEKLLYQLGKQEKNFLGIDNKNEDTTIFRIKFEATTCKDYYLVPGCPETFIPAGKSVTIFGQLRNKRWRCVVQNDDCLNNNTGKCNVFGRENSDIEKSSDEFGDTVQGGNDKQFVCCYPLIGSIPSSIIAELNDEGINEANNETSEAEESNTDTERKDINTKHTNSTLSKCDQHLLPSRSSSSFRLYSAIPIIQTVTAEHLEYLSFQRFPSVSSTPLPTLPESPTESTIAELNMALENLAKITPHSRPVSGGSDCSRDSWTSGF